MTPPPTHHLLNYYYYVCIIYNNNNMTGPGKRSLHTRKSKSRSDAEHFCYTGVGARKSGNHTRKEFMKLMDKKFKRECSGFIKTPHCKSCVKRTRSNAKLKPYQLGGPKGEYSLTLFDKCYNCKYKNIKKCNLKEYLLFSGAEVGKC